MNKTDESLLGKRVKVISQSHGWGNINPGDVGIIKTVSTYSDDIDVDFPNHSGWICKLKDLVFIDTENKITSTESKNSSVEQNMNLIEKVKLLVLNEPEKTFRKLNITDENGKLTVEGEELFKYWLFNKYKDDFKKEICEELLKEIEKK